MLKSVWLAAAISLAGAASVHAETIRMWTFLNPAGNTTRERALSAMIKGFESRHPGTNVQVEVQGTRLLTPKFLAANSAGNAPDVIWINTDSLGELIRAKALADLYPPLFSKWPKEEVESRHDIYWDRCSPDGKAVYCAFMFRNYISVLFRMDLFEKEGIDPASIKTWDDLTNVAKRLTVKDASGAVTRYGFGQSFSETNPDPQMMIPYMLGSQDSLFKPDGRANFATDAGVEGLRRQIDMVKVEGVTPESAATAGVDDLYEQFAAGRFAMIEGATVRVSDLQRRLPKGQSVGQMLWPGSAGNAHNPAMGGGWAAGVWAGSKNVPLAAELVGDLVSVDADRLWSGVGEQLPFTPTVLKEKSADFAKVENQPLKVSAEGLAHYVWIAPVNSSVNGFREALNRAAQKVLVNGVAPKQALDEAEAEFNKKNGYR